MIKQIKYSIIQKARKDTKNLRHVQINLYN